MHAEIDDMMHQAKNCEEKAKKAMIDAARLADELRAEQDHTSNMDKGKRMLESQLSELDGRLAEAGENATKGGRSMMAKLEGRIRELEIELGGVQARTSDTFKTFQKSERHIKELQFQQDEDRKNHDRITELAQKTSAKDKGLQETNRRSRGNCSFEPCCAFLYFARFKAAISSASSTRNK